MGKRHKKRKDLRVQKEKHIELNEKYGFDRIGIMSHNEFKNLEKRLHGENAWGEITGLQFQKFVTEKLRRAGLVRGYNPHRGGKHRLWIEEKPGQEFANKKGEKKKRESFVKLVPDVVLSMPEGGFIIPVEITRASPHPGKVRQIMKYMKRDLANLADGPMYESDEKYVRERLPKRRFKDETKKKKKIYRLVRDKRRFPFKLSQQTLEWINKGGKKTYEKQVFQHGEPKKKIVSVERLLKKENRKARPDSDLLVEFSALGQLGVIDRDLKPLGILITHTPDYLLKQDVKPPKEKTLQEIEEERVKIQEAHELARKNGVKIIDVRELDKLIQVLGRKKKE
jgi:hypothetical protein